MAQPKRYGLPASDIRRVSASVRRFEGYYRHPAPAAPRGQVPSSNRTVPVICPSGGIASGSKTSPTSGTGNFAIPGTGDAIVAGDTVKLWNYMALAIGSGSKLGHAYWWNGKWIMVSWEC